jgi:homoaconitate hydratase
MAQNLIEKIVQRFAVDLPNRTLVHSGDFVTVKPRHVMTHDNTAAVMMKFNGLDAQRMNNPKQPVFTLDHNVQDKSDGNLKKYASIEGFASDMGVDFHPAGRGIGHQVMLEDGYAWPGTMVVASDSHSNVYGGIGALGTPVVRTDAAAIWATGETWWQIPPVSKVVLSGELRLGVSGKDVIVALCGLYNQDQVLNHALEFSGPGVANLSVEERLTIANMTTEWGALAGVFPCDAITVQWLRDRAKTSARIGEESIVELENHSLVADAEANYEQIVYLDLGQVVPCVCGPDTVKVMNQVSEIAPGQIPVHKAYLLSCVNGRTDDLATAAAVLDGKRVADGVELYVAPASDRVQAESEARGDWQKLMDAGAIPLTAGCGPCIGMGVGLLKDGEVGISATNRNFKGRMGSRDAQAYLASPAVVAASAIAGYICAPEEYGNAIVDQKIETPAPSKIERETTPILDGFPATLEGELLFCDADNLNTDGIYPGKYTYREDMSKEQMAAVAMENYDENFQSIAQEGDLLLSGFNFGTGSSREQAATSLAYRGIRLVIAGSYSATYKRNAFNNGYLLVDCPDLLTYTRKKLGKCKETHRTGMKVQMDFRECCLEVDGEKFNFAPLGPTGQRLVIAGGLENQVLEVLGSG